ncbi:hypothetical protein I6M39_03885 [Shewanella algae]|nr:hypothetical protein [Shewanella algae]
MAAFYYNNIPKYILESIRCVRESSDNLWNSLLVAEVINNYPENKVENLDGGFDVAIFTGDFHRFLIKKVDGYFSMSNPFQVQYGPEGAMTFHCDIIQEPVDGRFISIMRNAISAIEGRQLSHDDVILSFYESFNLDVRDAASFYDAFTALLSIDHGYFRFDDDSDNEDGHVHPRYHFDIFYRNSSSLKIGYTKSAEVECFLSLVDHDLPKKYLYDHQR